MLTEVNATTATPVVSPAEQAALTALLTEGEAPVSDAPLFCPPSNLLLAVVLSPKTPKDNKGR